MADKYKLLCKDCLKSSEEYCSADHKETCFPCGSTNTVPAFITEFKRKLNYSSTIELSEPLSYEPSVLLQSFVVPIGKTTEGAMIKAALVPWREIIKLITRDPNAIFQIEARRWEEIIAAAYEQAGFDEVILTPRSGDGGKDVIAIKKGFAEVRIIDQVKAYKPGHLVKADEVRALLGVLHTDPANKGFVTTTSSFAPRIKDDPSIAPLIPKQLGLRNGEQLVKELQEIANQYRQNRHDM